MILIIQWTLYDIMYDLGDLHEEILKLNKRDAKKISDLQNKCEDSLSKLWLHIAGLDTYYKNLRKERK